MLRLSFAFQVLNVLALASVKFSLLFFYLRVFVATPLRRFVWATVMILAAWTVTAIFSIIFSCRPVRSQWDITIPGSACIDQVLMVQSLVFTNVVLDLAVMALPIPTILRLQMRRSDKIGVLACVLLGFV